MFGGILENTESLNISFSTLVPYFSSHKGSVDFNVLNNALSKVLLLADNQPKMLHTVTSIYSEKHADHSFTETSICLYLLTLMLQSLCADAVDSKLDSCYIKNIQL